MKLTLLQLARLNPPKEEPVKKETEHTDQRYGAKAGRWSTDHVIALLRDPRWTIELGPPGGDHDTSNLTLSACFERSDEFITVCGFNVGRPLEEGEWDDCDVEMVEVSDGQDSRGGLNTGDLPTCLMYAHVVSRLRKAGFNVVPQMKDYF